jgi:hypothetical protein
VAAKSGDRMHTGLACAIGNRSRSMSCRGKRGRRGVGNLKCSLAVCKGQVSRTGTQRKWRVWRRGPGVKRSRVRGIPIARLR